MPENNTPLPDAALAELDRLYAAATPGEWQFAMYCKPDGTEIKTVEDVAETLAFAGRISPRAELFGVSVDDGKDICMTGNGPTSHVNADSIAALHNAYPALRQRLADAERERNERVTMAARAQEAMRYMMNGLPANDAVWAAYGNADSARAWLAARDARMKREGAVEAFNEMRRQAEEVGQQSGLAKKMCKIFADECIEQAAKRLRDGGE